MEPIYRVFLTRHYIAVEWVDLKARSPLAAKRKAVKLIRKHRPDVRVDATDNGWIGETPITVADFGTFQGGKHEMTEISKDVFIPTR